jgi:hypothetical protein
MTNFNINPIEKKVSSCEMPGCMVRFAGLKNIACFGPG